MSNDNKAERPLFVALVAGVGCFMLSFVAMGLAPWTTLSSGLEPPPGLKDPYHDENGELTAEGRGKKIYAAEACWHCHSQFVRPVANKPWRYGPKNEPWESMFDVPNHFGTRRIGPDLAREAGRRTNDWHFAHLADPRSTVPRSIMPPYPWMFETGNDGKRVPTEKAKVAFFDLGGAHLELVASTDASSSIARSIEKRGEGLHHICLEVENIDSALALARVAGLPLVNETPVPGAGGSRVAFIHPKGLHGVLIELVERPRKT